MPSTRRAALRLAGSALVAPTAGCVDAGPDDLPPRSDGDFLLLSNGATSRRALSVVVERDGERVAGGRYRLPADASATLALDLRTTTHTLRAVAHDGAAVWRSWSWPRERCVYSSGWGVGDPTPETATSTGDAAVMGAGLSLYADDVHFRECVAERVGHARRPRAERYRVGDAARPPA
ncbi:hypothetical protein [Halobaculum litoreum]|uniref:Uncharacterized protein n=1 Tax=Halobaculum litoreum TaxID=3031998 RepID=A0ABD5XVN9_9EURY|nr:hypothetical protein [Halobaculum sp. DT92]